jgi:hypothetical protein
MGKPIIWNGANAKLINSGDLIDRNSNSLTNGGKANYTWTGHGLTVGGATDLGRPVYLVSATALAFADQTLSANAEVIGFIYAVLDANTIRVIFAGEIPTVGSSFLEGGGSLVPGSVYFLAATAGKVTATEPTTIGYVSKPLGVAVSTTKFSAFNMRGSVVGSANARTQITLANNATTTVQDVSLYDAGSLEGWVYIDAPTDIRFYVKAPFSKYGAAANYYISPSYVGDTPPAGFTMTVTAAGLIQITMPTVSGYASAVINFALNAPAVGTNFPLSVDAASITSGTITAARLPQVSTSSQGAFPSLTSSLDDATATQLGLKQYLHGTTYNGGIAPTVVIGANVTNIGTVNRAAFIPYQTQDGAWRLRMNITTSGSTSTSAITHQIGITGVVFKNITGFNQSLAWANDAATSYTVVLINTNQVYIAHPSSIAPTGYNFSGDVELNAKPTWAY